MKIALCQTTVHKDWHKNLRNAERVIADAVKSKADMVVLPEMFICPYNKKAISAAAQPEGGEAWQAMSEAAAKNHVYLVAGSIPESADGHIYSTAYTFDREGRQIGKYRKMHMFDIDVEGGQYYSESSVITAGDEVCVVETEFGPIGVAICYDVRFPELFRLLAKRGAKAVVMPASFNRTTGPAHWELLMRHVPLIRRCTFSDVRQQVTWQVLITDGDIPLRWIHGDRSWRNWARVRAC